MKALEEFKEKRKNMNHKDWIKKVLDKPEAHFEIVVRFAQEAQKRLGNKDE
jgi:ribosomal protein L14E/L6E/L27E